MRRLGKHTRCDFRTHAQLDAPSVMCSWHGQGIIPANISPNMSDFVYSFNGFSCIANHLPILMMILIVNYMQWSNWLSDRRSNCRSDKASGTGRLPWKLAYFAHRMSFGFTME